MRGLLVSPAGLTVLLAFEDDNPQLWVDTQRAWAALCVNYISARNNTRLQLFYLKFRHRIQVDFWDGLDQNFHPAFLFSFHDLIRPFDI